MNIPKFITGILLIIPGAFMITDGILVSLGQEKIFFQIADHKFEFIVGYALIILGTLNIDSKRGK